MRKTTLESALRAFFLFLATFVIGGGNAFAEETLYKTLTFSAETNSGKISAYDKVWSATIDGFTWTIANFNNNNNIWDYVRCGRKDNASTASITNESSFDEPVSKVVVTIDKVTAAKVNSIDLRVYEGDVSGEVREIVPADEIKAGELAFNVAKPVAGNVLQLVFDCAVGGSNGLVQVSKVEYYVNPGGGDVQEKAAAPTLPPACEFEGESQVVTITNNEAGATVYYTTDGNAPTTESTSFTGDSKDITVTATTTVKAMAAVDGKANSPVASATYTKVAPMTVYENIAAFAAAQPTEKSKLQLTDALVYGKKGTSTYLSDATGTIILYGTVPAEVVYGKKVTMEVTGTYAFYQGLPEVAGAAVAGTPVVTDAPTPYEGQEVAIGSITDELVGKQIVVKNVGTEIDTSCVSAVKVKDANGNELTVYDAMGAISSVTFKGGVKYDIAGLLIKYFPKTGDPYYELAPEAPDYITEIEDATRPEMSFAQDNVEVAFGVKEIPANTLTCTSDGQVAYTSSNPTVATVAEDGTVTYVAPGLTTITATAAATETYREAEASYTLLLVSGDGTWEHPYSPVDVINYSGINGATEIAVAGYYVGYPGSGAGNAVGKEMAVTAMALSTVAEEPTVTNTIPVQVRKNLQGTFTVEADKGKWVVITGKKETYFSKPGIKNSSDTQKLCMGEIEVTAEGYATYYSSASTIVPAGMEAGVITMTPEGKLSINYCYAEGEIIPANTGVLLKAEEGKYAQVYVASKPAAPEENLLRGTLTDETTVAPEEDKDYRFYKLSQDNNGENVGFYWGAEDGAAFTNKGGHAYLAIEKAAAGVKGFSLTDLETGIGRVEGTQAARDGMVYDLQGRRVERAVRGLYIQNGRKVMVK